MTKSIIPFIIIVLISLSSCWPIHKDRDGKFMEEVQNLEDFNSEFDDYNSALPMNRFGEFALSFSSTRGQNRLYQLTFFPVSINYDMDKKKAFIQRFQSKNGVQLDIQSDFAREEKLVGIAPNDANVFGPAYYGYRSFRYGSDPQNALFLWADDAGGDLDIKYAYRINGEQKGPFNFDLINSEFDDAYPTINSRGNSILFCSNRDGDFDIFELKMPELTGTDFNLEKLIHPETWELIKKDNLNSPADDKCPSYDMTGSDFITMVSDRPGGEGGFDIYYSTPSGEPQNAGKRINTAYNEYRPILPDLPNFSYYMMIFSSDRPGGMGGYDLYATGLKNRW